MGASSSSLLLALMERWGPVSLGTVPLYQPGWSKWAPEPGGEERKQPPELGCLATAGRGASEPFQGQESIYSPFHPIPVPTSTLPQPQAEGRSRAGDAGSWRSGGDARGQLKIPLSNARSDLAELQA